jgi:hypothetical protein
MEEKVSFSAADKGQALSEEVQNSADEIVGVDSFAIL